jgi:hypothetical protein
MQEPLSRKDAVLDFQIEKTYQTLLDVSRSTGKTVVTYLALIVLALCLAFGESMGIEDKVKVPIIDLTVDKRYAAAGSLILSYLTLLRASLLIAGNNFLDVKFRRLLHERYGGLCDVVWHMKPPSFFDLVIHQASSSSLRGYGVRGMVVFSLLLPLIIMASPALVTWNLCKEAGFSNSTSVLLALVAANTVVPVFYFIKTAGYEAANHVKELDDRDWALTVFRSTGKKWKL